MRYLLGGTAAASLLIGLGACSLIDAVRYTAAELAAGLVVAECALSKTERHTNLQAVNGRLATDGRSARAVALDCDGDGAADL